MLLSNTGLPMLYSALLHSRLESLDDGGVQAGVVHLVEPFEGEGVKRSIGGYGCHIGGIL